MYVYVYVYVEWIKGETWFLSIETALKAHFLVQRVWKIIDK